MRLQYYTSYHLDAYLLDVCRGVDNFTLKLHLNESYVILHPVCILHIDNYNIYVYYIYLLL